MVVDTIKTIKDTEKEADLIVEEADKKCKAILEKATSDTLRISEAARSDGLREAKFNMEAAKVKGNEMLESELKSTDSQAKALQTAVSEKEDEAINAIIAGLI